MDCLAKLLGPLLIARFHLLYLVTPLVVYLAVGPMLKRGLRNPPRWRTSDFYQGIPMILSSLTAETSYALDRVRRIVFSPQDQIPVALVASLGLTLGMALATIFLGYIVVLLHRKLDQDGTAEGSRSRLLAFLSFFLGLATVLSVTFLLKYDP